MATRINPPKKVRLACRRCRARRIKCDGQVPACTNCAKVGEVCLDVDNQNSGLLVPRNFAGAARARIQWLEDIIKTRLPDVDLTAGPQVDPLPESVDAASGERERQRDNNDIMGPLEETPEPSLQLSPLRPSGLTPRASLKRPHDGPSSMDSDDTLPERAHSVAMNLGMLSLNSDSSQRHYLGSSSGLLFTNLIGASPSTPASSSFAENEASHAVTSEWLDDRLGESSPQQHYLAMYRFLQKELPRKDDALVLVHTYIRWIHPEYPVLEPSSLISALNTLYYCVANVTEADSFLGGWPSQGPAFRWNGRLLSPHEASKEHVTLPNISFILFMVFNIAAIVKIRTRVYEYPPERFYRAATHFSNDAFSQISLASIQGLVCLVAQNMLTPADVNIWTLIHICLAHCVELGIHREEPLAHPQDAPHQQIRRFIFYTIYSLDRSVSSIQGRPLGFRDETFDIKMPEPQPPEAGYIDGSMPSSFSVAVARYALFQFELDRIISDIKLHFYHLPGASSLFPQPEDPMVDQIRIRDSLEKWWEKALVEDFGSNDHENKQSQIWRMKLKAKYHSTMILLCQPSQVIPQPSAESLQACFENASAILYEYQKLHDLHALHHGWRTVQNIFAAGATLIYSFWTCPIVRLGAIPADLSRSLRTCSNLLTVGGEWWPSVKKGQSSFGLIADSTIRKLYTESPPSKNPRLMQQQSVMTFTGDSGNDLTSSHTQIMNPEGTTLETETPPWYQRAQTSALNMPSQHETWQGSQYPAFDASGDTQLFPEIENFFADFDRADFTWSFPLHNIAEDQPADSLYSVPE